jgi:3-hydroxyacyl-CoA dehydrogenase
MNNQIQINKVAVLGCGVMGSQIAAHLSNANIPVYAFDINQDVAEKGIAFSRKLKPSPYYNPKTINLITPLNYDDHIEKISECDWVIEVIAERLDWKNVLYQKIFPHLKKNAIVTSNTSGISLAELTQEMDKDLSDRFFITHFFNPPRYMKLVEIIQSKNTNPEMVSFIVNFMEEVLGKGVVYAKDTPNFVANRIGVFGMMTTLNAAQKYKLSVENVDALTGTLIGRPKSATFRTADVVGLDTLAFVADNAFHKCVNDEQHDVFKVPDYLKKMIENKWLGQKSGQGFYKKIGRGNIHSLNLNTLEYQPQHKERYPGVRIARENSQLNEKIHALAYATDTAGKFTWDVLSSSLIYSANRLYEITDDIVNIDRGMRWGFGWDRGPFELWDILGLEKSIQKMKDERKHIPAWILKMADNGITKFYDFIDGNECFYSPFDEKYLPIKMHPKAMTFNIQKKTTGLIKKNWSASVIDLDDGVAGVEFHSVLNSGLNPIDGSIMETLEWATNWVKDNGYNGLVISSDSTHFSAGANLNLILNLAIRKDWDGIDRLSKSMQDVLQGLRFAPFPVIAAPFGMVLGGGYETIGACDKIVSSAELYCGLVEVGVGLIPGGGGNLRMIMNFADKFANAQAGPFPISMKSFEAIGFAKVSSSAKEAQAIGYLTKKDKIVINRDFILSESKSEILKMAVNYKAPIYREDLILPGLDGRLVMESSINDFRKAGKISAHDGHIATKLSKVLTGGDKGGLFSPVDEQYLLDIEREAFVSLSGEPKSIARIQHMLKKGKPLRN